MAQFDGRVAVVTGAAQGIGRAVAERLAAEGATVSVWDIDADLGRPVAEVLGGSFVKLDQSDPAQVDAATQETEDRHGRMDILVASAGIAGANGPVAEYPTDAWLNIMNVNLNGVFYLNRAIVRGMIARNYGRIVNVASIAGKEGNPNAAAYSASKAGVIALTKALGKETADRNIAVNCVTPAAARTRIFDQMEPEFIEYMLSKIPRGRFVEVDEIAAMISWLCRDENSFATGGVFDISGGRATY